MYSYNIQGRGLTDFVVSGKNVSACDALRVRKLFALGEEPATIKAQLPTLAALTDDEVDVLNAYLEDEIENGGKFVGIPLNMHFGAVTHPLLFGSSSFPSTACDVSDLIEADQALQILANSYGTYGDYLAALQPMVNSITSDPENPKLHNEMLKKLARGDFLGLSALVLDQEREIKTLKTALRKNGIAAPVVKKAAPITSIKKTHKKVPQAKGKNKKAPSKSSKQRKTNPKAKKAPAKPAGKKISKKK